MSTREKKIEKTCFFWNRHGDCKHGENCHFLHYQTPIIADPPRSWTDYGEGGPPPKPVKRGHIRDGSETGSNNWEQNNSTVETGWDKQNNHNAVADWDQPSSPAPKAERRQPKAVSTIDEEWEQAQTHLVNDWYPPTPKANDSVAASTVAGSTVTSAGPVGPGPPIDHSDNIAIRDIWETLLPQDFAKYAALRQKYATSDPEFEIDTLVVYLYANPFRLSDVEQYLNGYSDQEVGLGINAPSSYEKLTAIFFAVATNEPKALKLLIDQGADVNSAIEDGMPVLAFAIMHGSKHDTTEMVRILLANGADPTVIPDELVSGDRNTLNDTRGASKASTNSASTQWCTGRYRAKLASTINITQRYWLAKSRNQRSRTPRELMVARREKCQELFQIPYSLIGQEFATGFLMKRVLSHLLLTRADTKPLVVVFTGSSGHGKTELAKSMGSLLSTEFLTLDCTEMSHATDLFGPKAPYPGYEEGSALNNFLCRNHGQRSVVFLDDFEKMGAGVHESLLIPFAEGKYRDRRTARSDAEIDCSRVVWILATSKVDNIIEPYYRANLETFHSSEAQDQQAVANLMKEIEGKFLKKFSVQFGTTFAGRISVVLPFIPFSPLEQAVIAHKYILEIKRTLAADIDVEKDAFMGHIKLEVEDEPAVCRLLADNGYDIEYGARSIKREMQKAVHDAITQEWLESSDEITNQRNSGPYERYSLVVHPSGEYVYITKSTSRKGKGKAKANTNGNLVRPNGAGGVRLGNLNPRSGTPSSVGTGRKPLAKVGKLIDIGGGELMKTGWDD